ncbi:MAG: nucleoside recognition domain-containing protein [Planctomycetota bacterium]
MEGTDGSGARLLDKARVRDKARQLLHEALKTSFDLFKIIIPVSILTRMLQQLGVVAWLGGLLGPVMRCVGLPGEMGLVWATAMITNIYGGMVVFVSLAPGLSVTAAQASVLGAMILVAHSLPVELRIAQKAGPRFRVMVVLRVAGALVLGLILHGIYSWGGFLQMPCRILWDPGPRDPGWGAWAAGQARMLLGIFLIILGLLLLMKLLKRLGITALLTRLLEPVLTTLGMSREAAPVTIIGMTLGLSYGGGLIIQESRSGRLGKRDVFFSLALMGLCHSLIEDTLLMMAIGSHHSAVLWGRLVFALAAVLLLVKLLRRVPDETFDRYFFRAQARKGAAEPA